MEKELKNIFFRKKEMEEFMENFKDMPDRLLKYCEILLEGKNASPYSYQNTMSFRKLAIGLTSRCNKSCQWCFRFDPAYKDELNKDLPFKKIEQFVKNTKGKFRLVHLGGLGEPTLYPRLFDIIKLSKKLSNKVKITTNASLLDKNFINKLIKSGLTHIEVSMWTVSEKQEKRIRNVDLKKTIENIVYMANKTPLAVQVNTTVCSLNYDELPNLVNKLKKAKKLLLHTIPLFETAQCRKANIKRISAAKYKQLLSKIKNRIIDFGLGWDMFPTPEGSVIDPIIEMKKKKNICFSCFEDPYISEAGEFLPCGREMSLGGVDASIGFERAWNHPTLLNFRANMLKGNYPALCGQLCYLKEKKVKK